MKITIDVAPEELAEFIFNLMDISVEADTDNDCQCDQRTETIKPAEETTKPVEETTKPVEVTIKPVEETTTDTDNNDNEIPKELFEALAKAILDKALSQST